MITIKHRFTNETICEFDVETVKEAAEKGRAYLRCADLHDADLRGADLRDAYLRDADMEGADLSGADLRDADLRGADLPGADLRDADLRDADMEGADLRGADLRDADLRGADLRGAYLRGADLRGADMRGADLEGEKLTKTPLSINGLRYWCLISDGYMRLGCKRFTHDEWSEFTDEQISEMDFGALECWKQWKEPLLSMCKSHANKK